MQWMAKKWMDLSRGFNFVPTALKGKQTDNGSETLECTQNLTKWTWTLRKLKNTEQKQDVRQQLGTGATKKGRAGTQNFW